MSFMEKVRFYVPIPPGFDATAEQVLDELEAILSSRYGGATIIPGVRGTWLSEETGEKIDNEIVLVESIAPSIDMNDMEKLALYIKNALDEESVLIEIDQTSALFT